MEHDVIVEWKRNLSWNWPEWNNRVTSIIWVSSDSPSGIFAIYGFQKSSKYVFFVICFPTVFTNLLCPMMVFIMVFFGFVSYAKFNFIQKI